MTTDDRAATPALTCAEVDELAGAIALEALPDDEAERVAEHLHSCTQPHRELQEFQEVAALLPLACDQVEPPAALRHRILAEALAPIPALRAIPTAEHAPPRRHIWQLPGVWAAAAALLIAVGLGVWNVQLHSQLNDRYQAGQRAQLQALLAAGRIQPLLPQANGQGISAAVVLADNGHTYLTGKLPTLPAGKVYELWVIAGGTPRPAGTFSVSSAGTPQPTASAGAAPVQYAQVQLTAPVSDGEAIALTEEPAGGSVAPSESPRAIATVG